MKCRFPGWHVVLLALVSSMSCATAQAKGPESAPAVAAQYETRSIQLAHRPQVQTQRWYVLRSDQQIETWAEGGSERQVWRRSADGEISHARLFPADRRAVDYSAGDLRALGRYPHWRPLAEIIDVGLLERLKDTGTVSVLDREARRYQGQVDGVDLEIWWLPQERLPGLVRRVWGDREVSTHLLALYPLARAPWPPADVHVRGFTRLDYADLGDMEADPFVQKLHAAEAHAGHGH